MKEKLLQFLELLKTVLGNAVGTGSRPSSIYIALEDGRITRFGGDDYSQKWAEKQAALGRSTAGEGWMGLRGSAYGRADIAQIPTQDDPFYFNKFLFGDQDAVARPTGKAFDTFEKNPELSSSPKVGDTINEFKVDADGKITHFHGGNQVSDIYEKGGKITLFDDLNMTSGAREERAIRGGTRNIVSVSSLDDLEFQTKPGKFFPVQVPSVKETEPVTKRIGPTPPESGTTLKNVGKEPAQTRLRGKAIEKVYPAPNQSHEGTMADIANIKKQRQESAEAAVTAEQNAREKNERKVKRREVRKTEAEAAREARETAEKAAKNPGGIPVRRTGRC